MAFVSVKDFTSGLAAKLRTFLVNTDENVTVHGIVDTANGEILGVTTGTKVTTDANGSLQQYLRGLVSLFSTATFKAASTAPVASDPALVVTISPNSQNANGTTTDSNSTPVAWSTEGKAQLGAVGETAPTTDTASSGLNGRLQRIAQRLTSMLTSGLSNRAFSVTFATLTRPANTTAYTAGDSISDNATAGSVTALVSGNISDVNNDPIFINEILVSSTDTGLAGKKIRAYIFNSNPTSSTGVGAGDNSAYSQKVAGYLGSFMGWMETGFSDGTVGRLVPCFNETNFTQAGGFIVAPPVSGARTLYIQYQAVEAFTPSANSTTIIGTARGWQGRAV